MDIIVIYERKLTQHLGNTFTPPFDCFYSRYLNDVSSWQLLTHIGNVYC